MQKKSQPFLRGRFFHRQSIVGKVLLVFAVLAAVLIGTLCFAWAKTEHDRVFAQFYQESIAGLQRIQKDVADSLQNLNTTRTVLLTQTDFVQFCVSDMQTDGLQLVKFTQNELKTMRYLVQSNSQLAGVSFYFDNIDLYELWDTVYHLERITQTGVVERVRAQRRPVFCLQAATGSQSNVAAQYSAVEINSHMVGVMELRIAHTELFRQVRQENTDTLQFFVAEEETAFVYAAQETALPVQVVAALKASFAPETLYAPLTLDLDGEAYLAVLTYEKDLGCYYGVVALRSALLQGITHTIATIMGVALLLFVVTGLLCWVLYRYILRRLSILNRSMRKVEQGDWSVRIPNVTTQGDDLDHLSANFNRMLDKMQTLQTENTARALSEKDAQLQALQSQIDSHFLYNALENIRMMAVAASQMPLADTLYALGSLLRYKMQWKEKCVPLSAEIENVTQYVFFCNSVQQAHITLTLEVPQHWHHYPVPKLLLQPLVENSVQHGQRSALQIAIRCYEAENAFVLQVQDDGAGMSEETLRVLRSAIQQSAPSATQSGIGLVNVHRRVQLHYGCGYGVQVESVPDAYTVVKILLPCGEQGLGGW